MIPKYYFGNYPNSTDYDENIPVGWNKWDAEEIYIKEDSEEINLEEDE